MPNRTLLKKLSNLIELDQYESKFEHGLSNLIELHLVGLNLTSVSRIELQSVELCRTNIFFELVEQIP